MHRRAAMVRMSRDIQSRDWSAIHVQRNTTMSISLLVVIVLIILLIGSLPTWGYSRSWGYRPTGGIGIILLIILVLWLLGVFH
jgi:Protein of unknown function (DUF3309)